MGKESEKETERAPGKVGRQPKSRRLGQLGKEKVQEGRRSQRGQIRQGLKNSYGIVFSNQEA